MELVIPGFHARIQMVQSSIDLKNSDTKEQLDEMKSILHSMNRTIRNLNRPQIVEATTRFVIQPTGGDHSMDGDVSPVEAVNDSPTPAAPASTAQPTQSTEQYQFSRDTNTIARTYREWSVGLHGLGPVSVMEKAYQDLVKSKTATKSYRSKDSKWFNRSRGGIFLCLDAVTAEFGVEAGVEKLESKLIGEFSKNIGRLNAKLWEMMMKDKSGWLAEVIEWLRTPTAVAE